MNYRLKKTEKEELFVYNPKQIKSRSLKKDKKISRDNPFGKLSELRFR